MFFLSFLVLTGLTLYTRIVHLLDYPYGLNTDSALYALSAILLERQPFYLPFIQTGYGRETLHLYWILPFFHLFGYTEWALKFSAAVVSIVTIISLIYVSYRWFSPMVSFVSGFFLIFSRWHFLIGKLVFRVSYLPLFSIWMFHFLFLASSRKKIRYLILAGIFSGLSLLTYEAGKVIPFIGLFTIGLNHLIPACSSRSSLKNTIFACLVFILVSIVIYSPMLFYASNKNDWQILLGRGSGNFVWQQNKQVDGGYQQLKKNLVTLGNFFSPIKRQLDNPLDEGPLISPIETTFLIAGIFSIMRRRGLWTVSILSWFLIGLLPGIISWTAAHREVVSIIPLMMIIGIGVEDIIQSVKRVLCYSFLLLGVALLLQVVYFWQTTYSPLADTYHFHPGDTVLGYFLSNYPDAQKIYFAPLFSDTVRFIAHQQEVFVDPLFDTKKIVFNNLDELKQRELTTGALIILPVTDNFAFLAYLEQKFPKGLSFSLPCVKTKFCQSAARIFVVSQ